MYEYSDPLRAEDPCVLPDLEIFEENGEFFYWSCFPGCLPDSEKVGPFESYDKALEAAREN